MDEIEFETEMTFKQVDYLITVKKIQVTTFEPSNQRLFIEVEEKLTGELWRGEFPARYIEDITTKTGVPKKFPEFIRMVLRSLKGQEGDSVYIDLLTYADLEQLKSKRSGSQANSAASQNPANSRKRYIILTELMNASGVDKVHYPLPLNYLEEPEPDALRRTIERMRGQILMQRSNAFSIQSEPVRNNRLEDFATIEKENDHLRREVAEMERQFSLSNQEFFNMSQQKFFTESEYDFYKTEAQRELQALQQQVRDAEAELNILHQQMRSRGMNPVSINTQSSGFSLNSGQVLAGQASQDIESVKRQLQDLQRQLEQERGSTGAVIIQQEKEIEECRKELEAQTQQEQKLRERARLLQEELDQTLKRIEQLQRGGAFTPQRRKPLYGPGSSGGSKNTSPFQRNSSNGKNTSAPRTNSYTRNPSNGARPPGGTGISNLNRPSPNRFGQANNVAQKPLYQRNPVGQQQRVSPGAPANRFQSNKPVVSTLNRNTSSNTRSGSLNNRTGAQQSTQPSTSGRFTNVTKPTPYGNNARPANTTRASNSPYSRLYQNTGAQKPTQNRTILEDAAGEESKIHGDPVNINIVKKEAYNKENNPMRGKPRPPPAVGGGGEANSGDIYENIDSQDINSKLSRLQDLLKMAKNN